VGATSAKTADVEHCVVGVHLQHGLELVAVPAIEPFLDPQPIEDLG
jgi:hypothetical protein